MLAAKGLKRARYPFAHGAMHELPDGTLLADSYHCSRLNTNTGRLTTEMFEAVFARLAERLRFAAAPPTGCRIIDGTGNGLTGESPESPSQYGSEVMGFALLSPSRHQPIVRIADILP